MFLKRYSSSITYYNKTKRRTKTPYWIISENRPINWGNEEESDSSVNKLEPVVTLLLSSRGFTSNNERKKFLNLTKKNLHHLKKNKNF